MATTDSSCVRTWLDSICTPLTWLTASTRAFWTAAWRLAPRPAISTVSSTSPAPGAEMAPDTSRTIRKSPRPQSSPLPFPGVREFACIAGIAGSGCLVAIEVSLLRAGHCLADISRNLDTVLLGELHIVTQGLTGRLDIARQDRSDIDRRARTWSQRSGWISLPPGLALLFQPKVQ